jgi:molybdopterin-guanine dinucleotide biosynthesis protein A
VGAPAQPPISGVIVAGGVSRRMGQDKRRLRLWGADGPTLLEHTLALLQQLCAELIVVLNDPEAWPALPARVVGDAFPDGGALGGIYSGLQAASSPHALVVAADLPLLSPALLQWMIARPRDYDVLVPRLADSSQARNRLGVESLHAIYGRACLEPMRRQLEAGNPQVIGFFDAVRVTIVEPTSVAALDPAGHSFLNVNTPAELAQVERLLAQRAAKDRIQ